MDQLVIGFTGPLGAGKSTAAKALQIAHDAAVLPFAGPLKRMLIALGVPWRNIHGTPEDKLEPLPLLGGKSARWAMQTLGTEWGRNLIHPNLWTIAWTADVKNSGASIVVVDDVRFPNEAALVREFGGLIIQITRGDEDGGASHESEEHWRTIPADYQVVNNRSVSELERNVLDIIQIESTFRGV